MPPSATNHGLSVFTPCRWGLPPPLPRPTGGCVGPLQTKQPSRSATAVNDATSGEFYDHRSGHEGLDFACGDDVAVHAMYGGVVVEVQESHRYYGKFVTIQSCTDLDSNSGFVHKYAHLSAVAEVAVQKSWKLAIPLSQRPKDRRVRRHRHLNTPTCMCISSPLTGTAWYCRLENMPPQVDNEGEIEITTEATRISGCMNFVCFLPASHGAPPVTFDFLRSFNQLLSARDSSAQIPVYEAILSDGTLLR